MFRRALEQFSVQSSQIIKRKCYSSFCTINSSTLFSQQIKNASRAKVESTRMIPPPSKIVQIPSEKLRAMGLLRTFGQFAEFSEIFLLNGAPRSEGASTPSASWIGINLKLKENPHLKNALKKPYTTGLRVGKLMEILDIMGGIAGYRYINKNILKADTNIVTLCVDHFELFESNISIDQDIFISSYVTYAGNTSLEVRLDVTYTNSPSQLLASAYFVYAARDATNNGKAKQIPKLVFDEEENSDVCALRAEYGNLNTKKRKESALKSSFKTAPNIQESEHLHDLFKESQKEDSKQRSTPISKTLVEKTLLMHLQDTNIYDKIFGGYMMREAIDLAWITAHLYGKKGTPDFLHIDDILFLSPVEVGSISIFKAWVTYVENNLSHVMVTVDTIKSTFEKNRTFEMHMTLFHPESLTKITPLSYLEGMAYIEGQRRINNILNS